MRMRWLMEDERGQSTVEYALVVLAFLAAALGLAAVWRVAKSGALQQRAREAASHNWEGGMTLGFLQDLGSF